MERHLLQMPVDHVADPKRLAPRQPAKVVADDCELAGDLCVERAEARLERPAVLPARPPPRLPLLARLRLVAVLDPGRVGGDRRQLAQRDRFRDGDVVGASCPSSVNATAIASASSGRYEKEIRESPTGSRATPSASNHPGISSAYIPFRIDVHATPDSRSICSVAPCERAWRNTASGPALRNDR
jgi:hypothetical protein